MIHERARSSLLFLSPLLSGFDREHSAALAPLVGILARASALLSFFWGGFVFVLFVGNFVAAEVVV